MSKRFKYTKITSSSYLDYSDEYEEDGEEFEYEVDNDDLADEIADLLYEDYFKYNKLLNDKEIAKAIKESIKNMIMDGDWVESLADEYEDTLKEIFEEQAFEAY